MSTLTIRIAKLLNGETEGEFESASQLFKWLWNNDAALFEQTLIELLQIRSPRPALLDEIEMASHELADAQFKETLFRCVKTSGVSRYAKHRLSMFLVSVRHPGAIERFDKSFRSACSRFLKGKLDDASLVTTVYQACMLRRTHLYPTLGEMLESYGKMGKEQPYIHIFERQIIETLYLGLRDGRQALTAVLDSPSSSFSQKEAAVYGLGCECSPDLYEYFTLIWQRESGWDEFPVRRECVNAIVYSCDPKDVASFLTEMLESEREAYTPRRVLFLRFSSKRRADIVRLLLGATYCPLMDEQLVLSIRRWFDVEGPDGPYFATFAHLALEEHGVSVGVDNQGRYAEELQRERRFRESHFDYCSLLTSRKMFGEA